MTFYLSPSVAKTISTRRFLRRLASEVARILRGKDKPIFTPHVDTGDYVVVVNAEKIKVTGKKAQDKEYDYYTHFPGGHKFVSFADMMAKKPEKVIELAIRRMLPKSKLGRQMLKKLIHHFLQLYPE